jgi:hypothetical protein
LLRLVEHGTIISDFNLWERWSATEQMTALWHWYLYAENHYGLMAFTILGEVGVDEM